MARLALPPLPDLPSAAAAEFHHAIMPQAAALLADAPCLTILFTPADHAHTGWRLAAVQTLAREHAPARVNAVAGTGEAAIAAAIAYLEAADGVTGQYLPLDDAGAGPVV
ncbi:MAG: Rossmann fold domain-containing protein [Novosphingobium sp.]